MFINPELAKERVLDPNNILNSIFQRTPTPKNSEEVETLIPEVVEEEEERIEASSEAVDYILGLRSRKTLPETSAVITRNSQGKTPGDSNYSPAAKEMIGTLSALGSTKEVSKTFNVSQPTIDNIKSGRGKQNKIVAERINQNLSKVVDKALDKLVSTIDFMDEDKLESLGPKDQAAVAGQLSKVVANLNKRDEVERGGSVAQLIIYAPTQINESRYEMIELK